MTSKCDIIRDMGLATSCGLCSALEADPQQAIPEGCKTSDRPNGPPKEVCGLTNAANVRMKLFATKYDPTSVFMSGANKAVRTQSQANYGAIIAKSEQELGAAYPKATPGATDVGWTDVERCLWNADGSPGGPSNTKYFERTGANFMGMNPEWPLGQKFASGTLWKAGKQSPVPITVDYMMNPDLFAILMFALVVIIFGILMWKAWKDTKAAPDIAQRKKDAEHDQLEASDPYAGSAFETYYDPGAKCRKYVYDMESQGYEMTQWRTKCGMPPLG